MMFVPPCNLGFVTLLDLPSLMSIWRRTKPEQWSTDADIYRLLAERTSSSANRCWLLILRTEGLKSQPNDFRLRQLFGLALSRSGASEKANVVLANCGARGVPMRRHSECWRALIKISPRVPKILRSAK